MEKEVRRKNIRVIFILIFVLIMGIIGITFAITYTKNVGNIAVDMAGLGVEYHGDLKLPNTNLEAINDNDIYTNTDNVLTVTFSVKGIESNPDMPIIYDVILSDLDIPYVLLSKYLKWQLKKNNEIISNGSFSLEFDTIKDNVLILTNIQQDLPTSKEEADNYEFKLWLSDSCQSDDLLNCVGVDDQTELENQQISGKIETVLYTKEKETLKRNPSKSYLLAKKLGLNIRNDVPNFMKYTNDDTGIYEAKDDYGYSYYYRGAVENNYVRFADCYWRIVRIEGNGNIRLIYDGTEAHANGESSSDRAIDQSEFNIEYDDNAYVGYMYGEIGADSYEKTHANINSSTIKTYLEDWYDNNLESHSNVIAEDTVFCNDRSISNVDFFGNNNYGYSNEMTTYRWYIATWFTDPNQPQLTCPQLSSDGMSVSSATKGNRKINRPIGLITIDEATFAGGYDRPNRNYYLYTGDYYWTMSSSTYEGYSASVNGISNDGSVISFSYVVNTNGVRPVISLKPDTNLKGQGTMEDPYVVIEGN